MLAIFNSLNAHNLPIFQPILIKLLLKSVVHKVLSDKTYTGTPLEHGTWTTQFAISIISGHDRYYAVPHPPAHGTSIRVNTVCHSQEQADQDTDCLPFQHYI